MRLGTFWVGVLGGLLGGCQGDAGPKGDSGPPGSAGQKAEPCTAMDNQDGTYTLNCPDGTKVTLADAAPCTVSDKTPGTHLLACPDGTSVTVQDGSACAVKDKGNGTYELACGGDTVTVANGASCSVAGDGNGAYTLTCGTETVKVANGTPCSVTGEGGLYTITCGDGSKASWEVEQKTPPSLQGHLPHGSILAYDVQAAYNDDTFFWRLSYRGNHGVRHDYLRYTQGAWVKEGGDRRDAQATIDADEKQGETELRSTVYEQRTSLMVSDPTAATHVNGFDKVGCFATCHDQARHMPQWEDSHGEDTKWVDPALVTGSGTKVLDLWHWRGARSSPIDKADDQYIAALAFVNSEGKDDGGRKGDAGTAVFKTNSVTDGNPAFVFDPSTTWGDFAFKWDAFWETPLYYFVDPNASGLGQLAPNPTAMAWNTAKTQGYAPSEGDVVPGRILQAGAGSRADITAFGTEFLPESPDGELGVWHVQLQRKIDTGNDDDVALVPGKTYYVGFEVHLWEYTTRDHYVSFPQSLSVADPANAAPDIAAVKVEGSGTWPLPNFDNQAQFPVARLYLFQPGIASWEFLTDKNVGASYTDAATGKAVDQTHGGASGIASGTACRTCHTVRASEGGLPMETLTRQRGGVFAATPVP